MEDQPPAPLLLAPTDLSDASLIGVTYAANFARRLDATLVLLHVASPKEVEEEAAEGKFVDEQLREIRTMLLWWFTSFVPQTARQGVRVETRAAVGHPEKMIPATAEALQAQMIIMATHGRTGLRRAVLGSVAEAVVRRARCPVLTVRAARPAKQPESLGHDESQTRPEAKIEHPADPEIRSQPDTRGPGTMLS